MRRIEILGLCLVVMLAFGVAGVASTASAFAPERGTCKSKPNGKYKDSLCLEEGGTSKGHEFEWTPAKSAAFTSTTGATTLKSFTPAGAELPAVECKKSKGKGKEGATTSASVVTFEECSSAGETCTGGAKAKAGQIITFELEGTLGVISGSDVGEAVGGKGPGGLSSEFECGGNEIKTGGAVIGEVTPVDAKRSKTATLKFTATGSKQEPESFEGGPAQVLHTEINGLGGGTFPFVSTEVTTATDKGASTELREGKGGGQVFHFKPVAGAAVKETVTVKGQAQATVFQFEEKPNAKENQQIRCSGYELEVELAAANAALLIRKPATSKRIYGECGYWYQTLLGENEEAIPGDEENAPAPCGYELGANLTLVGTEYTDSLNVVPGTGCKTVFSWKKKPPSKEQCRFSFDNQAGLQGVRAKGPGPSVTFEIRVLADFHNSSPPPNNGACDGKRIGREGGFLMTITVPNLKIA